MKNETPLANPASKRRGQITLEDVKKMSNEELNIEVAKLTGWTPAKSTGIVYHGWKKGNDFKTPAEFRWSHDLNAVHYIEKDAGFHELRSGLNWNPRPGIKYRSWLRVIAGDEGSVIADARQRCEALVLCLSERGENAICRQPSNPDRAKGVSNL